MKGKFLYITAMATVVVAIGVAFLASHTWNVSQVGSAEKLVTAEQTIRFQQVCVRGHMMMVVASATAIGIDQLWENTPQGPRPVDCK